MCQTLFSVLDVLLKKLPASCFYTWIKAKVKQFFPKVMMEGSREESSRSALWTGTNKAFQPMVTRNGKQPWKMVLQCSPAAEPSQAHWWKATQKCQVTLASKAPPAVFLWSKLLDIFKKEENIDSIVGALLILKRNVCPKSILIESLAEITNLCSRPHLSFCGHRKGKALT